MLYDNVPQLKIIRISSLTLLSLKASCCYLEPIFHLKNTNAIIQFPIQSQKDI